MGFVDVSHEGIKITIDKTAYQKICYVPPCTYMTRSLFVKNADGTFKLKNDERVKNQKCIQVQQPGKWQILNVSTKSLKNFPRKHF